MDLHVSLSNDPAVRLLRIVKTEQHQNLSLMMGVAPKSWQGAVQAAFLYRVIFEVVMLPKTMT